MWNLLRDPDGRPALTYGVVPEPTNGSCAAWLAAKCGNTSWAGAEWPLMMSPQAGSERQSLAAFLLLRGRYAWWGRGWGGGDVYYSQELQSLDPGVPAGDCAAVPGRPFVYRRRYTRMTVTLDCVAWNATLRSKSDDETPGPKSDDETALGGVIDGGGYLGIRSDIHGLYHAPMRALRALRSDFHFARDQSLSASDPTLELPAVSGFGDSMHLQLDVMRSNSSRFALELSVLGGAMRVSLDYVAPPRGQCTAARNLFNNSIAQVRPWQSLDRPEAWASWMMPPPFGNGLALTTGLNTSTPAWCRAMCCANSACSGWTFTDPQFSQPSANMCWLFQGVASIAPGGPNCDGTNGHCWAGLGRAGQGRWTVRVNGERFIDPSCVWQNGSIGGCRPVPSNPAAAVGAVEFIQLPTLDLFVDGTIVQVLFNGHSRTIAVQPGQVNGTNVSLTVGAGASLITVHAWRMAASSTQPMN